MSGDSGLSRIRRWRWSLTVAICYLGVGVAWISISDPIAIALIEDERRLAIVNMYKAWGWMFVSSLFVFGATAFVIERWRRSESALERTQIEYSRLVESINEGVWITDPLGRTIFVNERLATMIGQCREDLIEKGVQSFLKDSIASAPEVEQVALDQGEPVHSEMEVRCDDGSTLWTMISSNPIHSAAGDVLGVLRIVTDISDRKKSEDALHEAYDAQRRLLNELHHRMRNNLASLHSLIELTRRSTAPPDTLFDAVQGRISAMTSAHELLTQSQWQPVSLHQILGRLIDHKLEGRVYAQGPSVLIVPERVGPLAAVLNELVLNAKRHGSLRSPNGRLGITWTVDDRAQGAGGIDTNADEMLRIQWNEREGVPLSGSPPQLGIGLSLVQGLVRTDLRGRIMLSFPPEGASHEITLPMNEIIGRHGRAALPIVPGDAATVGWGA